MSLFVVAVDSVVPARSVAVVGVEETFAAAAAFVDVCAALVTVGLAMIESRVLAFVAAVRVAPAILLVELWGVVVVVCILDNTVDAFGVVVAAFAEYGDEVAAVAGAVHGVGSVFVVGEVGAPVCS